MNRMFVLLLMMSGCGKAYIDPSFQPYVNRWNNIYEHKVDVPMYFKDLSYFKDNTVGLCDGEEVFIDPSYFNTCLTTETACFYKREQLIFHELGHCVLGLEHNTNKIWFAGSGPYPESIMYPQAFGDDPIYDTEHTHYVDELKQEGEANEKETLSHSPHLQS